MEQKWTNENSSLQYKAPKEGSSVGAKRQDTMVRDSHLHPCCCLTKMPKSTV